MNEQGTSPVSQIDDAVERVVRSGRLGGGDRLPALLRYLVREQTEGRGERIKSFTIATEVFGRGQNFDPQGDGIVRVEMGRLRQALALYNATEGALDPVRITIPKGSYRPDIKLTAPAATGEPRGLGQRALAVLAAALAIVIAGASLLLWQPQPAIITHSPVARPKPATPVLTVAPPAIEPQTAEGRALASDLQAEIVARLSRQPLLAVVLLPDSLPSQGGLKGSHRLDVRLSSAGDTYTIHAFLSGEETGAVRWSASYERHTLSAGARRLTEELAGAIARDVGALEGAVFRDHVAIQVGDDERDRQFACLLAAHRYWRSYAAADRETALACLGAVVQADPTFAEGRGALSLLHIDRARRLSGASRSEALGQAREVAGPLAADAPPLGQTAALALAACEGDRAAVLRIGGDLVARYPHAPAILADVASKLGLMAGEWERAKQLEARALELNPRPDPWYPLATIVEALVRERPGEAARLLERAPQRGFVTGHVLALATGAALGDAALVRSARTRIAALGYPTPEQIDALVAGECWSDEARGPLRALLGRAAAVAP